MTGKIKLTVMAAVFAAIVAVGVFYTASRNLYKNPSKGTFVFERIEDEKWMFI